MGCFDLAMRLAWPCFDLRVTLRSVSISFGWLVGWLIGWLVGWFVGWLVGWLAGWLVG